MKQRMEILRGLTGREHRRKSEERTEEHGIGQPDAFIFWMESS